MEQNQPPAGMVFYNYNPVDGTLTSASTPVQIEFGSADVARQINQQVQLQYSNLQSIQPGQTQQIVITTQPTFDTTEDIDPMLIKASKTKIRSNGERVPCQLCGKTFSCNANLRDHLRLHTGERPFQCAECGMSFAQRSNWRLHKRVHTGERPYMCGICGKTFSRSSHLPGHIRVHTGERPFECDGCEHTFSSSQALKNHMRTHTGEKPFECEACSTSFTHSSTLSSHKKRCTGEKRKRGRPVGSGRRRKRSLNRPRGRPKKGRFGRRRKKTEEITETDPNVKEEMIVDAQMETITCATGISDINGTDDDHTPQVVDIAVSVLSSVPSKHEVDQPLLCNVTEPNDSDTLLCKMTESDGGEPLLCNITEVTNSESLLCNISQNNNADRVMSQLPENSTFPNESEDIKPIVEQDVIKAAAEAAGLDTDLKPDISSFHNVVGLQESNKLPPNMLSRLPDPSDLRQEAAVAMTNLHHSVINSLSVDGDAQTFL